MKKLFGIVSLLSLFVFAAVPVTAKQADYSESDLPTEEGTYDVPGNEKLKLHVHIYKAKNGAGAGGSSLVCNLADDNSSTAEPGQTGWKLPSVVNYYTNPSSVPGSVGGSNLNTIAANSFSPWSQATVQATGTVVQFINVGTTSINRASLDGKNVVAWGRTSGSALAVTYTWYYPDTGMVAGVDTIMNLKFKWAWSTTPGCAYSGVYDAQDIMTHEFGHWMGLDDRYTSEYTDNTMYGYGSQQEVKKNTLTAGDIAAIQALY